MVHDFDAKLFLVGRFITEGPIDFQEMQQTLATLLNPGKGLIIKGIDMNLYMFQFYHEIDVKRVIAGSPWSLIESFNSQTYKGGRKPKTFTVK